MSFLRAYLVASLACATLACSGPAKPVVQTPSQPVAVADESANTKAINALADKLLLAAREEEPQVTLVLEELANVTDGQLVGLEHRLKKRPSMIRKIRLQESKRIEEVEITDALRYTIRVEDDPEGRHVKSIVKVVAALEAKGYRIVKLKNYWPKGDSYSGVNSVLESPSGLQWELQFHTTGSLRVQKATRKAYEELRDTTTSVERKRELFDQMSLSWDTVRVPLDVLLPQSLHTSEQIIHRPRP